MKLLAQTDISKFTYTTGLSSSFTNLGSIITELLKYLFPLAGLLLFFYLIWGGFSYLTSGGDPKNMEQAKGKVTNAIVGFIIVFIAFWLVQLLDFMFGSPGFLK